MNLQEMSYREALRQAMREEMQRDETVWLLGEDIGEYGGSFKVTLGLQKEFGEARVRETPISESAIVGTAAGSAMTGLRPVAEMMFSDFITFGMDSLVNHAAKFRYMSNGQVQIPMVVRLPSGSGTGAGAQHSQSLEAWFCNVPGLKVCAPATPAQAKGLLKAAIRDNNPVVFIEYKLLYNSRGLVPQENNYIIPLEESYIEQNGSDITIVSWGPALLETRKAVKMIAQEGISCEIINPLTLYPMDMEPIYESVKKTSRLVIIHDGPKTGGVGGEIAARVAENDCFNYLDSPIIRIGGLDTPVPVAERLEQMMVPDAGQIADGIYSALGLN
ncbi:MAG: alpha-ketoacid dehydrogenase subunit beta [Eubacteriaceae bacterium]|jgi:pyruvate/2-oxoglutarate/acetoin dehydrogenase E1 component